MLKLRLSQLEAILEPKRSSHRIDLAQHLRQTFPDQTGGWSEDALHEWIEAGTSRAARCEIRGAASVRRFLDRTFVHGPTWRALRLIYFRACAAASEGDSVKLEVADAVRVTIKDGLAKANSKVGLDTDIGITVAEMEQDQEYPGEFVKDEGTYVTVPEATCVAFLTGRLDESIAAGGEGKITLPAPVAQPLGLGRPAWSTGLLSPDS